MTILQNPRTCIKENGQFLVGIHSPSFDIKNLRDNEHIQFLGRLEDGTDLANHINFPSGDLHEPSADIIYEIPNAFPFRGTTYINSAWADAKAQNPSSIHIKQPPDGSLWSTMAGSPQEKKAFIDALPQPLLIALAQSSRNPAELQFLAEKSCAILFEPDDENTPIGLKYKRNPEGKTIPEIYNHELFEVLVNNPYLPDDFKNALVLKPGVQGPNEITGEYLSKDAGTHVFEYLRRNSYIPWGHFASNMASDAIRYRAKDLSSDDMKGIRHLYYQRAYVRIAAELGIKAPEKQRMLSLSELESLRKEIQTRLSESKLTPPQFNSTLWGWNFGFGYAQSGHRLHASHQMIHQQNAMIPDHVGTICGKQMPSFSCGDLVTEFITRFKETTGCDFFETYLTAIRQNTRTDGDAEKPDSLIVWENENVLLFVPKAQVSEWELQLMPKKPVGNIIETDTGIRSSLDQGILTAVKTLETMGAQMITSIEFSKRINSECTSQHLLYSFIPRLPYAPGTFSEAQLRWISGCYPEDVAAACRRALENK